MEQKHVNIIRTCLKWNRAFGNEKSISDVEETLKVFDEKNKNSKYFYTIAIEGKFLPSNFMRDYTENIVECIKFTYEDDAKDYFEGLRKDKEYKLVKIECNLCIS